MTAHSDEMMGYDDETNTWVRCENDQAWPAIWDSMIFLVGCARDPITWNALLGGSFLGLVHLPKRLSAPVHEFRAIWDKGDSVLGIFGAINWKSEEYIVADTMEFRKETKVKHRNIVTSDADRLTSTSIITARGGPVKSAYRGPTIETYWIGPLKRVTRKGHR